MPEVAAQIQPGTRVRARADEWTVLSTTEHTDCEALRLEGSGVANAGETRTLLRPFDRVEAVRSHTAVRAVSRCRWSRRVTEAILSTHPFGALRPAVNATIDLLPYQFEPALAILRHARLRVLIADEVGLGKTIQAGIVISELQASLDEFRALIVTPAGVREQWRRELAERFGLETTLADTAWLMHAERTLPRVVNPWSLPAIYVTSLDLVKRPEVLRALNDLRWDLAVIDEVHGATPGTARLAAARTISSRARRLVLLTATPPDSEPDQFATMCDLGRAAGEDPITMFRRSRTEVGIPVRRRSILLPIRLSAAEREMHRMLDRYTARVWREAHGRDDGPARLASVVLRKRALSSAASLARSVRRRLELLGPTPPRVEQQIVLPLRDEDPLGDAAPDHVIGTPGLADTAFERDCLKAIVDAADRAALRESKLHALDRLLRRVGEPAIVFTEYRDTLQEIAAWLPASRRPLLLHGGLSPRDRDLVRREFTATGSLLLATDAASEGLNLHQRCRLVVHFELPWTATRLEQRTGRVDRLGQSRRVHEVVLVASHTAERLVLGPLLKRARAASVALRGWAVPGESAVTAAVMDGVELPLVSASISPAASTLDLSSEADVECRRLTLHREIGASVAKAGTPLRRPGTGIWIHLTRERRQLIVVVSLVLRDSSGRAVDGELVPLAITMAHGAASSRRQGAIAWANALLGAHARTIVTAAHANGEASRERVRELFARHAAALLQREAGIAAATQPRPPVVQAGLFDRRALKQAHERREVSAQLAADRAVRERRLGHSALRLEARIVAIRS